MAEPTYARLEDVVSDALFADVDIAPRRGRHIDIHDTDLYGFLADTHEFLELFYRNFGCDLVHVTDGYYYLRPTGDKLGHRQLSKGEMIVGQGLALLYLDPATLKGQGVIAKSQLLQRLVHVVGDTRLVKVLNPKIRKVDERVAQEKARKELDKALNRLDGLGFVDQLGEDELRIRRSVMRFAEPVRGLQDPLEALEQLIAKGEVVLPTISEDDVSEDESA